jgi:glycosyltransferase involved in cell wall biosynthesis
VRVLHVSAYYAPAFVYGGPPRSIHGLCRTLLRHGVGVEVFTTDANGPAALPAAVTAGGEHEGVPVRYFPRTWPMEPIGSRALTRALGETVPQVDVVHIHGLWNRVVWSAAGAARRAGVPYVLSTRGMLEDAAMAHRAWRKRAAYAAFERHTLSGAAVVHVTSPRERDTLQALRPGASIVVIPNGIDVVPAVEPAEVAGTTPPTILFVGRIHAIKRVDLLLDAFALVRAAKPDVQLVIAGPDEQGLRPRLEASHPGLRGAVTWTGAIDASHRGALLADARALVLCSDSESFGLAVVEGMAASRPVVVTRTCGWDEVEARGAGFLVDQRPAAIAAALMRLLDDPAMAAAMGRRGRAWVEQAYAWDPVAESFIAAYASVAASRAPAGATVS